MNSTTENVTPVISPNQSIKTFNRKVFARPFRLVFKKTATQEIAWINVESLDGLKQVIKRIGGGELVPVDSVNTLSHQLWGHLAEYIGFLRVESPTTDFSGGIQPLGQEQSAFVDDLQSLLGGDMSETLGVINSMRDLIDPAPVDNKLLKSDGINLTEEGEAALIEKVVGPQAEETIQHLKKSDNELSKALDIMGASEVDVESEIAAELEASIKPVDETPRVISGEDAEQFDQNIDQVKESDS